MKDEDKQIVIAALHKHGDSSWVYYLHEIDITLMKDGYELVVRKVGKR